jgi:ADP-ribose pyrophosphatase YjhB (NUDIX family)
MEAPGVGCGAWIEEDGRVLLVERLREPERGLWNLPGGKVDPGERVEDAIAREVFEELGVTIEVGRLLCVTQMMGGTWHWVSPVHRARILSGTPENREPAKHGAIRWWPLDGLPGNLGQAVRDGLAARS